MWDFSVSVGEGGVICGQILPLVATTVLVATLVICRCVFGLAIRLPDASCVCVSVSSGASSIRVGVDGTVSSSYSLNFSTVA